MKHPGGRRQQTNPQTTAMKREMPDWLKPGRRPGQHGEKRHQAAGGAGNSR
ncbi:MAG TPA: hypothetical protein VMF69_15380 [Gemmataceae bacterium]|nr:hypothetical protein [Gemmataceae bacterium]